MEINSQQLSSVLKLILVMLLARWFQLFQFPISPKHLAKFGTVLSALIMIGIFFIFIFNEFFNSLPRSPNNNNYYFLFLSPVFLMHCLLQSFTKFIFPLRSKVKECFSLKVNEHIALRKFIRVSERCSWTLSFISQIMRSFLRFC